MKRFSYTPQTDAVWKGLRKHDITSTESAALFDLSPYCTRFELYHRKRTKAITEIRENDRMLWGNRLQDTIAIGIAEDQGVKVRRLNKYIRLVESRLGSSFDFEVVGLVEDWDGPDTLLRQMYQQHGTGNFEIKCVDYLVFRDQWTVNDDKSIEAPSHIELQVQHQLHVSGRAWSGIGVLVSGSRVEIMARLRYPDVGQAIETRAAELFAMVKAGTPPPPDFRKDAAFVCKLYGYADPGKLFDGRGDEELAQLANEYEDARNRHKIAEEDKDIAKAKILTRIGDAEKAIIDGFRLSAGMVGPSEMAFTRPGYRNFRLTVQKPKKEKQTA
jgi:predicted phage-related endonuclease